MNLATLRRGLHETLRELQERFATAGEASPQALPSLDDAQALFERHWRAAVAADAARARQQREHETDAPRESERLAGRDPEGPFGALYRRHGLGVVRRAWLDLRRERGLPLPADAEMPSVPAPLDVPGLAADADAREETAGAGPQAAPLPLDARLEERVRLRVNGRTIELTLDRVEGARAQEGHTGIGVARPAVADAAPGEGHDADVAAQPIPAPLRYVRHRLGRGATGPADLRALLYALAAEQERRASAPELYQHNLTTGELERVRIDPKRRERLRDELTQVLAGMARGEYPAKPEPVMCQGCPFLLVCPG